MKASTSGRLVSILTGIGIFLLLLIVTRIGSLAFVGGVLAWIVVYLISSKKERDDTLVYDGITRADIAETIKIGRQLTMGMRRAVQRLTQMEIRQEVEDLCRIAESMFEMLKRDPKDIRIVKQFISHYLEPTNKIINKYAELATIRPMPADAIETLERTEKSLKNIRETFLKQKEKRLSNDVIDLDTEIKLFETLAINITNTSGKNEKDKTYQSKNGV